MTAMVWVVLVLALGVLAVGAVVATGKLGGMAPEPVRDQVQVELPAHPDSADIDALRFSIALRGYSMAQVDEVLDRLAVELAAKDAEIERLGTVGATAGPEAVEDPTPDATAPETRA